MDNKIRSVLSAKIPQRFILSLFSNVIFFIYIMFPNIDIHNFSISTGITHTLSPSMLMGFLALVYFVELIQYQKETGGGITGLFTNKSSEYIVSDTIKIIDGLRIAIYPLLIIIFTIYFFFILYHPEINDPERYYLFYLIMEMIYSLFAICVLTDKYVDFNLRAYKNPLERIIVTIFLFLVIMPIFLFYAFYWAKPNPGIVALSFPMYFLFIADVIRTIKAIVRPV